MLEIKDLTVSVEDKIILDNFSLKINQGEVHAIMGPNGSGKSTLSNVLCGKDNYKIKKGEIIFKEKNIFELSIDERAKLGLFLAFQYPVELPGVSITPFLKTSIFHQKHLFFIKIIYFSSKISIFHLKTSIFIFPVLSTKEY